MKKLLCLLLCAVMSLSLAAPALAEDMDVSLETVAAAAIEALEIPDDYTDFSGNWDDWLGGRWNLWWNKDGGSLSVGVDESGKILDVWRYDESADSGYYSGFDAKFPALSESEAMSRCEELLDRLVTEPEMAVTEESHIYLSEGTYSYSGTIYINNVPSPVGFRLVLRGDGSIASFSRDDCYGGYVGEVPSAESSVTQADAAAKLASVVDLDLHWVSDGKGQAALRYVPNYPRTIVDGASGDAVDMDALYAGFYETGMGASVSTGWANAEAAMGEDSARGLSEVELASIAGYAEAMTEDELDASLRAIAEIGLDEGFALLNASYLQDTETGNIVASLRYTKTMTADQLYGYSEAAYYEQLAWGELEIEKTITIDAKTGELQSLWTGYPIWEEDGIEYDIDADALCESFLAQVAPDKLAVSDHCTLADMGDYTWAQVEQGYFFPENRIELDINAASGTVDRYNCNWNGDVEFGSTEVIDEAKAKLCYTDALAVRLGYVAWPVAVRDEPIFQTYIDSGYAWVEELRLAWYYEDSAELIGIDALSGEAIFADTWAAASYDYTDTDDAAQKAAIEQLGRAGIGFEGGCFEPTKTLTMADAVRLMLQAEGRTVDDYDEEQLGDAAVQQHFVERDAWQPEKELTRMEFIKMLLCTSPYAEACKLAGVWSLSYRDKRTLDEADLGYAAVAQALGLVTEKKLNPSAIVTRGEAAQILCTFLNRE